MFSKGEENLSPDHWNFWRAREKELLKEIAKLEAVVSELKDELQEQRDVNKQLLNDQGS